MNSTTSSETADRRRRHGVMALLVASNFLPVLGILWFGWDLISGVLIYASEIVLILVVSFWQILLGRGLLMLPAQIIPAMGQALFAAAASAFLFAVMLTPPLERETSAVVAAAPAPPADGSASGKTRKEWPPVNAQCYVAAPFAEQFVPRLDGNGVEMPPDPAVDAKIARMDRIASESAPWLAALAFVAFQVYVTASILLFGACYYVGIFMSPSEFALTLSGIALLHVAASVLLRPAPSSALIESAPSDEEEKSRLASVGLQARSRVYIVLAAGVAGSVLIATVDPADASPWIMAVLAAAKSFVEIRFWMRANTAVPSPHP